MNEAGMASVSVSVPIMACTIKVSQPLHNDDCLS